MPLARFFFALGLLAGSSVSAEEWKTGFGQGFAEYSIEHGPGNRFSIGCDIGFSEKQGSATSVMVSIVGKNPPPNSIANVILDGDTFQLIVDEKSNVDLRCHACSDNFHAMWKRLRIARSMLVQYENGQSAKFDMKGARKALEPKPCKTPFEAY